MGYFKNLDVEQQEHIDNVVSWWKYHEDRVPAYLLKLIVEDSRFWKKVESQWLHGELAPRPASSHVALQPTRRQRRNKRRWDLSMSHDDAVVIMSAFAVITILSVCMAIWLAVTI